MDSKVTVKIYGQDYTILGEKTEAEIVKIAEYVDNKMNLISRFSGEVSTGTLGILSAINITEEYFDALAEVEAARTAKTQVENDCKAYQKMWEDTKKSFQQFKDNLSGMKEQEKLYEDRLKELAAKCNEYENSFFDLQMENIRLKSELEKHLKDK